VLSSAVGVDLALIGLIGPSLPWLGFFSIGVELLLRGIADIAMFSIGFPPSSRPPSNGTSVSVLDCSGLRRRMRSQTRTPIIASRNTPTEMPTPIPIFAPCPKPLSAATAAAVGELADDWSGTTLVVKLCIVVWEDAGFCTPPEPCAVSVGTAAFDAAVVAALLGKTVTVCVAGGTAVTVATGVVAGLLDDGVYVTPYASQVCMMTLTAWV
jgi:hypothetical protein